MDNLIELIIEVCPFAAVWGVPCYELISPLLLEQTSPQQCMQPGPIVTHLDRFIRQSLLELLLLWTASHSFNVK